MSQSGSYGGGSGDGTVQTITGNAGGAVGPDVLGDIAITGAGAITVTGTPGTNSLEITTSAAIGDFVTDAGTANPALGALNVLGGTNLNSAGAGSTVTVNLDDAITLTTVNASTLTTNVAAAAINIAGTNFAATGTDTDISINISSKGTGQVIINDLQLTTDLAVTEGGTGASTLTDHGVLLGSGTGAITALGVATNGQLVVGSTGADPVIVSLASTDGSLTITEGAGTLVVEGTDATETQDGVVELATDAEVIAGADTVRAIVPTSLKAKLGTQTDHGVLIGSGDAAAITALGVATNGQLVVGSTGADPVIASVGSTDGSLTITAGAGTLVIEGTDATETQDGVVELATDAEAIAGTDTVRAIVPSSLAAKLGTQTDHGALIGSGTAGAVTALGVAANGQLIVGSTGADPVIVSLASTDGSLTVTEGAGTLVVEGTDATETQDGVVELATNAEAVAGTDDVRAIVPTALKAKLGTQTDHGVLVGSGDTAAITALGVATNGQLIIGSTGADPTVGSVTSTDGTLTLTAGAGTLVIEGTDATETQDGVVELATDAETLAGTDTVRAIVPTALKAKLGTQTDHGVLVGSGDTAAVTALAVGTNGQVILGSTGADPVFATLASAGGTITFTPGAGTLNLESSAVGVAWSEVTGTTQAMAVSNGYIANNASPVVFTLPGTAALGTIIEVTGKGAGGWKIEQNASQIIYFGDTTSTTGTSGYLESTEVRDTVKLICVTANLHFNVLASIGNITVA